MISKFSANLPPKSKRLATMIGRVGNRGNIVAIVRSKGCRVDTSHLSEGSPERGEFLPPQPADRCPIEAAQLAQCFGNGFAGGADGRAGIAMGAAGWLRHDRVDDPKPNQILRG